MGTRRKMLTVIFAWLHWHFFIRKHKSKKTVFVLLPSGDADIECLALLYLDKFVQKRRYSKAIVVSDNPIIERVAPLLSDDLDEVALVTQKRMQQYLQYYRLIPYSNRLVIASLVEPYGRDVTPLIGVHGTTKEELFVVGVYRLDPSYLVRLPIYRGDDDQVRRYIDLCSEIKPSICLDGD